MSMSPATRNGLIAGAILFGGGIIILIIGIIANKLSRPNHHDEPRWGKVTLQVESSGVQAFSQHHRELVAKVLPELNRLGPTFEVGNSGTNLIPVVNVDFTRKDTCQDWAARFVKTTRKVEIDPTCTHGDLEFQTAIMHEVGHALGMGHICRPEEVNERSDCSSVGHGLAVMNPSLVVDDGEEHDNSWPVPTTTIQLLDIKEFQRVATPPLVLHP